MPCLCRCIHQVVIVRTSLINVTILFTGCNKIWLEGTLRKLLLDQTLALLLHLCIVLVPMQIEQFVNRHARVATPPCCNFTRFGIDAGLECEMIVFSSRGS